MAATVDVSWLFERPVSNLTDTNTATDTDIGALNLDWLFGDDIGYIHAPLPRKTQKKKCQPTTIGCKRKPGRKSIEKLHPDIPGVLNQLLQERGFQAQRSRAILTGQSGLALAECRDGLLQNIPALRQTNPNLAISTVQHMMEPPNKHNRTSKLYRCSVAARVPKKKNTYLHENENDHFYTARVKYVKEMITRIGKGAILISADNKAKVRVGSDTLATDRRQKIRRMYTLSDTPNFHQHDFPTPGYQITPCGYLFLPPNETTMQITDRHGRLHYAHPPTGQSYVINRSPYNRVGIDAHISDLLPNVTRLVNEGTTILALLVDGGPDYNVNHIVNEVFYGRLFRDTGLEALVVLSYCPGHLSLNNIERLWGTLTPPLVGVYLPDRLPGEDRPPIHQTLSEEEKEEKEHQVFNTAMDLLENAFWKDIKHDGQRVTVSHVPSGENTDHYRDYQDIHHIISNGKSLTVLRTNPVVYDEYRYTITHVDRRLGMSVFLTCNNQECDPCVSRMPLRNPDGVQIVENLPTPIPSTDQALQNDHFATYKEACNLPKAPTCAYMPSVQRKALGRCHLGCKYVFTSVADKTNHFTKMHPNRNGRRGRRSFVEA